MYILKPELFVFSFPTISFPASVHGTPRVLFPDFMPLLESNFQFTWHSQNLISSPHQTILQSWNPISRVYGIFRIAHIQDLWSSIIPFPEFTVFLLTESISRVYVLPVTAFQELLVHQESHFQRISFLGTPRIQFPTFIYGLHRIAFPWLSALL